MKHVFVVDDSFHFALRVYRVVSEAFEFGVENDEPRLEGFLDSPDGEFCLWWHNPCGVADPWQKHAERLCQNAPVSDVDPLLGEACAVHANLGRLLSAVRAACTNQPDNEAWVILDMRFAFPSERGNGFKRDCCNEIADREPHHAYFTMLERLRDQLDSIEQAPHVRRSGTPSRLKVRVMSSYRHHARAHANATILPKSLKELRALRSALYGDREATERKILERRERDAPLDVLVTGAGFELRGSESAIGLPATWQVLRETTLPGLNWDEATKWGFPVPKTLSEADLTAVLAKSAEENDLDFYWTILLTIAHKRNVPNLDRGLKRAPDFARNAGRLELSFRNAFRDSLIKYDFGHMRQHLLAARMPWAFWLTTNYTWFIDRAISEAGAGWQLLRNPVEADAFQSRELMGKAEELDRVAIKLHGDIGQVHTMAIAGYDKDSFSPFAVSPELHTMYLTAVEGLTARISASKTKRCRWHIVGHGLRDKALLELLEKVARRSALEHEVRWVAPQPGASELLRVEAELRGRLGQRMEFEHKDQPAQSYMWDLASNGNIGAA